jgi:hypothetical protein
VGGSCETRKGRTHSRNITSDLMSSQFSCEEDILCYGTNSVTIVEHNFFAVDKKKNTVSSQWLQCKNSCRWCFFSCLRAQGDNLQAFHSSGSVTSSMFLECNCLDNISMLQMQEIYLIICMKLDSFGREEGN